MVWKQDLAKLKQEFKEGEGIPPPPPPKPKPKPLELKPLDDEDALFLSAMGVKRGAPPKPPAGPEVPASSQTSPPASVPSAPVAAAPAEPAGFADALKDLKGLKPMGGNPILAQSAPAKAPAAKAPEAAAPAAAPPVVVHPTLPAPPPAPKTTPAETASTAPSHPVRIQLAAGMALEVDGSLDLRHHSVQDAEERLKDRLADAVMLSWRTLHLLLGPEPALHEVVQKLLDQGGLPVTRYAQAPIPLGGAQAWILYLSHPEA